ncbi:nibrin [Austrofundulus limnaeus]|uniref:Nibrin n=1 Tax=Austrofundulus limnaeus TaxID=52670 RepID=A0A2I4D3B8_AUSLI|nr:PREDICTED: nibrin-like [Austrofundulus limnaeus]
MWILTPVQPAGETHYLLPGKEYTVGRKNCDVLLPNDQSISRTHAHLSAADQTLTVKDSSKYGTFVNNHKLTAPTHLSPGDAVTFGVFESKFTVSHQKPVVCSSCLDSAGKALLTQVLSAVGGKLVNTWTPDCTHLVMPTVKVTIKTISALLCARPIVKPEFFSELSRSAEDKLLPPKAESFLPLLDEPSLSNEDVNLGPVPARRQLFTGKTFIFLTAKQLKRLSAAVMFGGGRSQLLEEGSLPPDLLESLNSCVVDVSTPLPPSSTEWANSVRSVLHRKGLRVIPESEIGLAAIYTSCDKFCNPSCLVDSDSAPKVKPRIPSCTMSQSLPVNETVLPAASQNITAYAVNTETTQRPEVLEGTGVVAVAETPERKRSQNTAGFSGSKLSAQTTTGSPSVVADTVSSSLSSADSQRRKLDSKVTGGGRSDASSQISASKINGDNKAWFYKRSPQKLKPSAQTSPQKQTTLTNFFQSVNKKRPLEEDVSGVMSEPKRPAPEPFVTTRGSDSSLSKEKPLVALRDPPAVSETPLVSAADLFVDRSEAGSEEPQSGKRKQEEEIEMEELESIMSMDLDGFDDELPSHQQEQLKVHTLTGQNQGAAEPLNKRQRTEQRENGPSRDMSPKKESSCQQRELLQVTNLWNKEKSCETSKNTELLEDEASFVQDEELLQLDIFQPGDETKAAAEPGEPVVIKQEVQESKLDEDLPKKLVLVEFRSLTVTSPPTSRTKHIQQNTHENNFKCFRKKRVPGAGGLPHIIGGSDLLVHNRSQNSDVDEWLKDAAEEERQNRRDETIGDDLFRYNPTKLTKRR